MGLEQISRVAGATMHDMISNAIRTNVDLQKAKRKDDKDKTKKSSTASGKTLSSGVGIDAGSVGGQDLSNMGDMRGRSSDSFSSEEDKEQDDQELKKDLDFFKKENIYKIKMGLTAVEEKEEEDLLEEDDYEEEADKEFGDSFEEEEENKEGPEEEEKEEDDDDRDDVLDGIKDKGPGEKDRGDGKEKDIKDGDPKHRKKDKYTSSGEEKLEGEVIEGETIEEGEEEREDIFIPQIQIKPTGIMMEEEGALPDSFTSSSEEKELIFNSPSLYEATKEIEDEEVSDEIKSSEDYKREQNNRNMVKKMIVYYPTVSVAQNLVNQMYILGTKFLETCLEAEVRIVILRQGENITAILPDAEEIGSLRAGYSEKLKVCFIGEEWVSPEYQNLYRFNASIYLMALAFDHAKGGDSFASLKSPFVLNNYHACRREEEGHQFIDGLSAFSPVEYFAQSVEAYFQDEENFVSPDLTLKVFEGKICTKNELYYTDLGMYQYIDYLANC